MNQSDGEAWRLFVALPVPAVVRGAVEGALAPVRDTTSEHLRWVPPATWHLTLAFLGDVDARRAEHVAAALARVEADAFDVLLRGASRFGRGLLFLRVDDDAFAAVQVLGERVRGALADADVAFDDKPLHPHLTLARQRHRKGRGVSRSQLDQVEDALLALPESARSWRADGIVLFRSHLGDGPVRHEPIADVALD